ncbi:DUF1345 domain-containing protein [Paenibacillus sp. CF384]|uniref:DUF1345 domain-containing protein n=1 Tax=Paenibacillus sp. CF384 TaxID=1884382 RepID=UPI00089C9A52|nr:DUF1345 domain-containing protein [Paenibacillus sp. CF384]SDW04719.1 Protein of unknown function [Paenibacillus sp. CF384]
MPEKQTRSSEQHHHIRIPRSASSVAVVIIGLLLSLISEKLNVFPSWIMILILSMLLVPMTVSVLRGHHTWTRILGFGLAGMITLGLVTSLVFLLYALFNHSTTASDLIGSAALLWICNIGVFAVWYWEIDRGGPFKRHSGTSDRPDFLFPQMTFEIAGWAAWIPLFLDYLYLAFNTNTAFSPTDTMVLSSRAKLIMMVQSCISLVIVAVVAARAINIA